MLMLNLGDSYTIGEAVSAEENFPHQLASKLISSGIKISTPEIIAKTGWTTDELIDAIKENPPSPPYDLVTLLIGVNNQYRGRSVAEYKIQFGELMQLAIQFAGNHPTKVMVISIPDWGAMPFAIDRDTKKIAEEIDLFNAENKKQALAAGCAYIDITGISREAIVDYELIAHDGLHPSAKQYSMWVEKMLMSAEKILKSN